ncbi:hypothetical protein [Myroides sp. N17-2]|uniref:hypothetical protein n=1 Tax=Myroides sp. N17-2 TaxID=2030799 RepID=UPI000EFBD82A|nr:hypothetical protein [Myroides sp. N17-2]
MKKIAMLFAFVASSLLIVGCEGSTGPQGPPGPSIFPYVMETRLSFDGKPNDAVVGHAFTHPVKVYDGDVLLVYILDGSVTDNQGTKFPVWTPLSKSYYKTNSDTKIEHQLEFSYNFSVLDYEIVASSDRDLGFFRAQNSNEIPYLVDRTFRIVYIPGANPKSNTKSVKANNDTKSSGNTTLSYEEAVRKYNLEDVKVVKNY